MTVAQIEAPNGRAPHMRRLHARKVLSAFRQGSSWPVLVDTSEQRVFTKLRFSPFSAPF
ncbi:MAG: hypothetical protein ABI627_31580 [Polyangiaceae bacterium]